MTSFLVIPAFNEEETITEIIRNSLKVIENIVVVNDCSSDNTGFLALNAGANVINLNKNKGYDYALEKGIKFAIDNGAKYILTFDADGQHPINLIKPMINLLIYENYEMVVGVRNNLPRLSEKIFSIYTKLFFGLEDITCGMKCYKSELIEKYGFGAKYKTIGTYLCMKAIKNSEKYKKFKISTKNRKNKSRFGTNLKTEFIILSALFKSIIF